MRQDFVTGLSQGADIGGHQGALTLPYYLFVSVFLKNYPAIIRTAEVRCDNLAP